MFKLIVIADDLTGANDVAVQFAKRDIATLVVMDWEMMFNPLPSGYSVLAVNTESRHVPLQEAQRRVQSVVDVAIQNRIAYFYKKTDSTLRGNIAGELDVLRKTVNQGKVMFIPANPIMGRTVSAGKMFVHGKPLNLSDLSQDPLEPAKESDIVKLLQAQVEMPCYLVDQEKLNKYQQQDPHENVMLKQGCYVFDSQSVEELYQVGSFLKDRGLLRVLGGSAGFAGVLPDLIEIPQQKKTLTPEVSRKLIVNGSLSPVSRQQIHWAEENGFLVHAINFEKIFGKKNGICEYRAGLEKWLNQTYQTQNTAILTTPEFYSFENENAGSNSEKILHCMGELIAPLVRNGIENLVIFGGDTSLAILRALGYIYLEALTEILPGIAFVRMFKENGNELYLVTKPGAFGDDDVIELIEQYFQSVEQ